MNEKNDKKQLLAVPMGLWAAAFVGLSLLYIIGLSLLTKGEGFSYSPPITLDNYLRLREKQYISSLLLSLRLAFYTTLISALVGYPFAYFISKASPKRRVWLLVMLIAPFWTNALIRIYGWKILFYANGPINTLLKSLGIIEKPLKLLYTEGAVLVGMVYGMLPFFVLPVICVQVTGRRGIRLRKPAQAYYSYHTRHPPAMAAVHLPRGVVLLSDLLAVKSCVSNGKC